MNVSVVIATYNRRDLLRRTLESVASQSHAPHEVIIADDGSTDSTPELAAEFPQVTFLRQENRGSSAARNLGVQRATGDVVAFTDDDCVVPPDWLERIVDGYERHPEVAGVGGYMEAPAGVLEGSVVARYEQYLTRELYNARDEEIVAGYDCPCGGTNNMSFRRAVLEEVGGFDESFPPRVWGEDADLKYRVSLREHTFLYVPVKVTHLRDYTLRSLLKQSCQRGRGEHHFLKQHSLPQRRGRALLRIICFPVILLKALLIRRRGVMVVGALADLFLNFGKLAGTK